MFLCKVRGSIYVGGEMVYLMEQWTMGDGDS